MYGPGDTFGEVELLNAEHYRSTVHVLTRSMLLKIEGSLLKSVFVKMPSVAGRLSLRVANQANLQARVGDKFVVRSRRTVAVTSLADHIHQRAMAKRLATAVHYLAGQRVLLLHVLPLSLIHI